MSIKHKLILLLAWLSASQGLHAGDRQFWFGNHNRERLAVFCAGASIALIGVYVCHTKKPVEPASQELKERLAKCEKELEETKSKLRKATTAFEILTGTGQVCTVPIVLTTY